MKRVWDRAFYWVVRIGRDAPPGSFSASLQRWLWENIGAYLWWMFVLGILHGRGMQLSNQFTWSELHEAWRGNPNYR